MAAIEPVSVFPVYVAPALYCYWTRGEPRYGMDIGACGLTLRLEFANSAPLISFAYHATTIFFQHFVGDACRMTVIPDRTD
jgi:hypothetical protein